MLPPDHVVTSMNDFQCPKQNPLVSFVRDVVIHPQQDPPGPLAHKRLSLTLARNHSDVRCVSDALRRVRCCARRPARFPRLALRINNRLPQREPILTPCFEMTMALPFLVLLLAGLASGTAAAPGARSLQSLSALLARLQGGGKASVTGVTCPPPGEPLAPAQSPPESLPPASLEIRAGTATPSRRLQQC